VSHNKCVGVIFLLLFISLNSSLAHLHALYSSSLPPLHKPYNPFYPLPSRARPHTQEFLFLSVLLQISQVWETHWRIKKFNVLFCQMKQNLSCILMHVLSFGSTLSALVAWKVTWLPSIASYLWTSCRQWYKPPWIFKRMQGTKIRWLNWSFSHRMLIATAEERVDGFNFKMRMRADIKRWRREFWSKIWVMYLARD